MHSSERSRPSLAMVVAAVALSLAIAGTAIAGPDALTRAVTKSKVKKIAKKQANKLLNQREASLNVNSAKTAESAGSAQTLNGVSVVRVFKQVPSGGAPEDAFTLGGLSVTLGCAAGDAQVTAISQVNDARILAVRNGVRVGAGDFDAGSALNLSVATNDLLQVAFTSPGGGGVTAELMFDSAPSLGSDSCAISGSAIGR